MPSSAARAHAWMTRDLLRSHQISQGGSPEAAYFLRILKNVVKVKEGRYHITNGAHAPADASCPGFVYSDPSSDLWCHGRIGQMWKQQTWKYDLPGSNPLAHYGYDNPGDNAGLGADALYIRNYFLSYIAQVWGYVSQSGVLDDDGLPIGHHVAKKLAQRLAGWILNGSFLMNHLQDYNIVAGNKTGETACESWSCVQNQYQESYFLDANIDDTATTFDINSSNILNGLDGSGRAQHTFAKIGNEYVRLVTITRNSPSSGKSRLTISAASGQGRGQLGTVATSHTARETVVIKPGWVNERTNDQNGGYGNHMRGALGVLALAPYDLSAGD
jgi:hypothetical protein